MPGPADQQQDHGRLAGLRHDGTDPQFRPVGRRAGVGHGELFGQRHGVEIADPHQPHGQGQRSENEQGRPGQREGRNHSTTVSLNPPSRH